MLASEITRSLNLSEFIHGDNESCLANFADTLKRLPDTDIETFLGSRPTEDLSQLAALIAIEMRHRWTNGRACRVEDYFTRFPELANHRERALDLIYAEFCERRQHESGIESAEYYKRFPNFRVSLERLFRIDSLFDDPAGAFDDREVEQLPEVGDTFLEFRLKAQLGRGASGRVFLAEQTTLSDRQVVVKITSRRTIEHQTLARLKHSNIVPILSTHHDELTDLRAVCMPYQCAVALSDVQDTWKRGASVPNDASAYLEAVKQLTPPELMPRAEEQERSDFPIRQNFAYATAWIMYKLASALHHAHLRGIYHRDLKPSNILLTASGEPLLVDFNLSFNQVDSGGDGKAFFGGTLPYMPPEQIQVMHPLEQGRADDVGPRADIYSLAATIFELLTGRLPFDPPDPGTDRLTAVRSQLEMRVAKTPSVRLLNQSVPFEFDALLIKCLDATPHRRYESAAQLASDLERYLSDRPLQCLAVTPIHLRFTKFLRRHRQRLIVATCACALAAAATTYLYITNIRTERERLAREKAESEVQSERSQREQAEQNVVQLETDAVAKAEEALARLPRDAYEYIKLGYQYFNAQRIGLALHCFNRTIELRNDYALAYYYRGRCLAALDRDSEALEAYTKSIKLDPQHTHSYLMRGLCFASSRTHADPSEALADLDRTRELLRPNASESTSIIYLDLARGYSAVTRCIAEADTRRENLLQLAEELLLKAFEMGLAASFVAEANQSDRFRMLDPLLERPAVRHYLQSSPNDGLLDKKQ